MAGYFRNVVSSGHLKPFREEHMGRLVPGGGGRCPRRPPPPSHAPSHKLWIGFGIWGSGAVGFVRACRIGFQIDVREVAL